MVRLPSFLWNDLNNITRIPSHRTDLTCMCSVVASARPARVFAASARARPISPSWTAPSPLGSSAHASAATSASPDYAGMHTGRRVELCLVRAEPPPEPLDLARTARARREVARRLGRTARCRGELVRVARAVGAHERETGREWQRELRAMASGVVPSCCRGGAALLPLTHVQSRAAAPRRRRLTDRARAQRLRHRPRQARGCSSARTAAAESPPPGCRRRCQVAGSRHSRGGRPTRQGNRTPARRRLQPAACHRVDSRQRSAIASRHRAKRHRTTPRRAPWRVSLGDERPRAAERAVDRPQRVSSRARRQTLPGRWEA